MAQIATIRGDYITLGQLLKLAGLIGTGGEARDFLADTAILVNGEPDNRRGRKIRPGDRVYIEGAGDIEVAAAQP